MLSFIWKQVYTWMHWKLNVVREWAGPEVEKVINLLLKKSFTFIVKNAFKYG